MRRAIINIGFLLLIMVGCLGCRHSASQVEEVITVDVTASYPKKELILQDIVDVEYIPLETNDEFITRGTLRDVGRELLVVTNLPSDGDIFLFDRKGKALKKINHLGQGAEEYVGVLGITLDENNNELFVNDHYTERMLVYDLDGNYKRTFKHKKGTMYDAVYNFDEENLICHDGSFTDDGKANRLSYLLVSKRDGSVVKEIPISFKEKKLIQMIKKGEGDSNTYVVSPSSYYPLIPYSGNWELVEPSADTVFTLSPDLDLKPFVARIPSVQSLNPEIFLFMSILTDRYYFMEMVEKNYDFAADDIPSTNLLYDKQENSIFKYTVYNDDYSIKKEMYMSTRPINQEIMTWQRLYADQLVESYNKGELKDRLKEIAANLDEESNPVVMLLKKKK